MIQRIHKKEGFTLVELLVGMMITSIIMTAVATLAFAIDSANTSTKDSSGKNTQVRNCTMRIKELVHNAKLVVGINPTTLMLWAQDKSGAGGVRNNLIDADEVVFIKYVAIEGVLKMISYDLSPNVETIPVIDFKNGNAEHILNMYCLNNVAPNILSGCSNVTFAVDAATPRSKYVTISFDLQQNGISTRYSIAASLIAPAFNRLDSTNALVANDDD